MCACVCVCASDGCAASGSWGRWSSLPAHLAQWRQAILARGVDSGLMLEERLHTRMVALVRGREEGRATIIERLVDQRIRINEQSDEHFLTGFGRHQQR